MSFAKQIPELFVLYYFGWGKGSCVWDIHWFWNVVMHTYWSLLIELLRALNFILTMASCVLPAGQVFLLVTLAKGDMISQ